MMKTQVLANDEVHLQLDPAEHLALTRSLFFLIADLNPGQFETVLGRDTDEAFEFAYGVYLTECAARTAGIEWLEDGRVEDELAARRTPSVVITYSAAGSDWCLTPGQLSLVQACASEVAGRASSYEFVTRAAS